MTAFGTVVEERFRTKPTEWISAGILSLARRIEAVTRAAADFVIISNGGSVGGAIGAYVNAQIATWIAVIIEEAVAAVRLAERELEPEIGDHSFGVPDAAPLPVTRPEPPSERNVAVLTRDPALLAAFESVRGA